MRIPFSLFMLALIGGCQSRYQPQPAGNYCRVQMDSLLQKIDTTRTITFRRPGVDSVFVYDRSATGGEGSVLAFDAAGNLGSYAFVDAWPESNFSIQFPANGEKVRSTGHEVVQWRFSTPDDSLVNLTVLFCTLDRDYGALVLRAGSFRDSSSTISRSTFTNIGCFRTRFRRSELQDDGKIYIEGTRAEKCGGATSNYLDSALVPARSERAQP